MPDRGHHRNRAELNRAGDRFLVERPEIFHRSAAAPDDEDVDAANLGKLPDPRGDFGGGAFTLHARRADDDMRGGMSPAEHLEDIAQRGAVERRHDADLRGQHRQRSLAGSVKEPFGLQPLLQLLEGHLQGTRAARLHVLADELILAFGVVDPEPAARDHVLAVFQLEFQVADGRPEHDGLNLRARVLQREIDVTGVPRPAVGDLPLDPEIAEARLEQLADRSGQLRDGVDAAFRGASLGRLFEWLGEQVRHTVRRAWARPRVRPARRPPAPTG